MAYDADSDSDATTCDPTWLEDESLSDVEIVLDSLENASPWRPTIALSPGTMDPETTTSRPRYSAPGWRGKEEEGGGSGATKGIGKEEKGTRTGSPEWREKEEEGGGSGATKWRGRKEEEGGTDSPDWRSRREKKDGGTCSSDILDRRGKEREGSEEEGDGEGRTNGITGFKSSLLQDSGFSDQYFIRPKFPHTPINKRKPLVLSPPEVYPPVQVPPVLNQYLRGYQQDGVQFLYDHYSTNTGAMLCDDMGLGKTVQVIAFMCAVLGKTGTKGDVLLTSPRQTCSRGCFLVVCPSSVLYNWTNEIEIWSHLKYGVYHRDKKDETIDKARRNKLDVVLTTHETTRARLEELNTVDWMAVFCDEVQAIKGTQAQVTAAMNSLRVKRRFGMTGTALQNNLTEFWCLLNWCNPGCLGSLTDFQVQFEKPFLQGQKYDCTKRQLALGRQKQAELEEAMRSWVLRRTKAVIASQLPTKDAFVVFCPISELQENIYQTILEHEDVQLILHHNEPCDCYSGHSRGDCCYAMNQDGLHWSKLVYEYLPLFTKCANHLGLLRPEKTPSVRQKEKSARAVQQAFSKYPQFLEISRSASFVTLTDPKYCGKMQVLQKLLVKFKEEKDKVIIFSQSTKLLDILQDYMISQGYTHCRLDGSTKIEERARLVHSFNTDSSQFIFLISKKCGGVGLNVTGANRVIIFDPSWNPATDLQAEDRAFRIGQSRDVRVYRLITEGTVEEMIYLRQVYKQQLANTTMEGSKERRYFTAVAGDKTQQGELFGYANLIALRKPGSSSNLTLDLLKRADKVEAGVKMAPDLTQKDCGAQQECDTQGCLLPGSKTIVHSGKRSVVGNSRVEEHISRQAQADVFELEQHSQEPANYVDKKLKDFSDESDDVDYKPPTPRKKKGKSNHPGQPPLADVRRSTSQADSVSVRGELEDMETRSLRLDHFESMSVELGFSSAYDFAQHVKSATVEERKRMLSEFYGSSSGGEGKEKGKGKGKGKGKVAPTPPVKKTKRVANLRTNGRQKITRKPSLQFEDSFPDFPPRKKSCNTVSNDEETLPPSTTSPSKSPQSTHGLPEPSPSSSSSAGKKNVPSTCTSHPKFDYHHEQLHVQPSLSLFGTYGNGSVVPPQARTMQSSPVTIDALFGDISAGPCDSYAAVGGGQAKRNVDCTNTGATNLAFSHQLPSKKLKQAPTIIDIDIDEIFGI